MMEESQKERLYYLLPTIYRIRDTLQGEPLRALVDALESEFRIVEQDIDALYDNWFIETCDDWVVPYIASQIGVYSPDDTRKLFPGQRRQVADTIAYRRRKGMVAVLEHVLRDVTGWYVRLIEYSQLLSLAPHLRTISERGRFADLHHTTELAMLGGPFETTAHTIDVRRIAAESTNSEQSRALQGRYSPDHVGVFAWRLQSYLMSIVPARAITRVGEHVLPPGCFTFDPLGRDMPLFTQPQEVAALTERPDAINLPGPISRVAFANDLNAYRAQHRHITAEEDHYADEDLSGNSIYYGPQRSLCVMLNGQPIPPEAVTSADLSQWNAPPASSQERESMVAIDVMLGRLRLLHRQPPVASEMVEVNYCYGFSADLGGGPYTRQSPPAPTPRQRINVLQGGKVSTLTQALKEWETCYSTRAQQHQTGDDNLADKPRCTIHIVDNGFYEGDLIINLPENADLVIEATDGVRPVIHGALTVNSEQGSAHLRLNGLLIDGKLDINGSLELEILHCTLMPPGLEARHHPANTAPTRITIDHSISGPIHLRNVKSELLVRDSIIDHASGTAIDSVHTTSSHGPLIDLERVTIFGRVQLQELRLAQDVIFTAPVEVKRQQCGLVSFSYVPAHSHTPRREHCQPQRTIHAQSNTQLPGGQGQSEGNDPVYPLFTSTHYGNAAYAQLDNRCSPRIRRGASNGSEMGAFNSLRQPQRQDNISQMLDEYLPFGLEAGVFYVT